MSFLAAFCVRRWKRLMLSTKILLIFIVLISISLGIQGIVTFLNFSGNVERRTTDYSRQIVDQINTNLDKLFTAEKLKLSLLTLYNQPIVDILSYYGKPQNQGQHPSQEERSVIFHYLESTSFLSPEVRGIHFMTNNGDILTDMDPYLVRSYYADTGQLWLERVREAQGRWVLIPQHYPEYLLENKPKPYISLARVIIQPGSMDTLGIQKEDFRLDAFAQVASNFQYEEIGTLLVVNQDKELFYAQDEDKLPLGLEQVFEEIKLPAGLSSTWTKLEGERFLVVASHSDKTGLIVTAIIPRKNLVKEAFPLRRLSLLIGVICLLASVPLAFFFSNRITRPLIALRERMISVQKGEFRQTLPAANWDEIGQLTRGFNRMSQEIERLMSEVYEIGLNQKEAEISALLSQMNPHFMYNTLESINMKAIANGEFDISDMVSALGSLLRYSIETRGKFVPLDQELGSVESYVYLQQIRYGSRLAVEIDVDQTLCNCLVPKLLLQPLVENALYHGIDSLEQGGTIGILAGREGDRMRLTVRDNGKGMNTEELERLRYALYEDNGAYENHSARLGKMSVDQGASRRHGVALLNLNRRVRLLFGPSCMLQVNAMTGAGAEFSLLLPIHQEENKHAQSADC